MNKKLVLALGFFASMCTADMTVAKAQNSGYQSVAQQGETPEQRADNQLKRLTKGLTLSTDQATQIKPLLLELSQKREAMREASDKRAARKDLQNLVMSQDEKMKTILSAEQYAKYGELKDEAKDRMKGRKGKRE
jgi:Spy/CpxP family protein refolding chaperone